MKDFRGEEIKEIDETEEIIIGGVRLDCRIFLAPMAGVADMPFRVLCRRQGCGLVYSEMVSAKGLHYNDATSFRLAALCDNELPAAVQIFGSDPAIMAEAAYKLGDSKAAFIDINMGCPVPKVTRGGEGSALMLEPAQAAKVIREVCKASVKPVTVKIRKGWDESSVNAVEIAKIAEASGAAAVTVHGRTREQLYSGKADREIIRLVKDTISLPVIGNGDIHKPSDAKEMLESTGCDAVMIGRAACGNPWIFSRTRKFLVSGRLEPEPSFEEKINMIREHMKMLIAYKAGDEKAAVLEMRKHIAWYAKGMPNAAKIRGMAFKACSADDVEKLLESIREAGSI